MDAKAEKSSLKKPSPVVVGRLTAYAVRPPGGTDSRWYWQAKGPRVDGKRPTLWSGRGEVDDVARLLAQLVVEHGARPEAEEVRERRAIAQGLSVAGLVARWIDHVEATADKYAANTRRNYRGQAVRITEELGGYAVDEVTPALLERYHSMRIGGGASKGTADLTLRVLRTAWNWARRNRLIQAPWPKPSLRLRDRTTRERPSLDEVRAVLTILRREAPEWCFRLASIIAKTGMRVSEAWGLEVGDVAIMKKGRTVVGGSLAIRDREGIAKTGARTVYVSPGFADDVASWVSGREREARLIGNVTQSTATMGAATYLRPAAQAIGASWTGWHAFRRAAADAYAEAGVDPVVAAAQLGHTVQVMQTVYRTVRAEQAQAAAAALADHQEGAARLRAVGDD